jgi:hypothetical protein
MPKIKNKIKNKKRSQLQSNKNETKWNYKLTLWEKIEQALKRNRPTKKNKISQELVISCMHIITESIKELEAQKDQNKQDQIIETFIQGFNQELSDNYTRFKNYMSTWNFVTGSIIINTTDPKYF